MVLGIPETQKVLYLLPIMLYHSFQLFYVSWLANRIGQQTVKGEEQIKWKTKSEEWKMRPYR